MTATDLCKRLPLELIAEIFSHLPVQNAWHLRGVSRTWRNTLASVVETYKNHFLGKPARIFSFAGQLGHRRVKEVGANALSGHYLASFYGLPGLVDGKCSIGLSVRNLQSGRLHYLTRRLISSPNSSINILHVTLTSKLLAFSASPQTLETIELALLDAIPRTTESIPQNIVRSVKLESGHEEYSHISAIHADEWHVLAIHTQLSKPHILDSISVYDYSADQLREIQVPLPEQYLNMQTKLPRSQYPGVAMWNQEKTFVVNAVDKTFTIVHFINDYKRSHHEGGIRRVLHCRYVDFDGTTLDESMINYELEDDSPPSRRREPYLRYINLRPVGSLHNYHLTIEPRQGRAHHLLLSLKRGKMSLEAIYAAEWDRAVAFWKGRAHVNTEGQTVACCAPTDYHSHKWKVLSLLKSNTGGITSNRIPDLTTLQDMLINESFLVLLPSDEKDLYHVFSFNHSLPVDMSEKLPSGEATLSDNMDSDRYCWVDASTRSSPCT